MKTFLAALWLAAAVPAAYGQWVIESAEARGARDGVTAIGEAEVRVPPDLVEIVVGVQTDNPELAKAVKENDAAVAAVIAEAKRHGVDPAHIQTEFINIWWDYYGGGGLHTKTVGRTIVITSTDIASFESLLPALIKAGANHMHRVRFMTSELRRYRDEARTLACKAAREKAQLMAKNLGRTLGEARAVVESPSNDWWSSYGSWWGGGGSQSQNVVQNAGPAPSSEQGGTAPGQITVRARVTVTFDFR
jgi:uncharacterized protein YggE